MTDFKTFMREREQAALAYCQGDAEPVNAIATGDEPASFFGPDGHQVRGAEDVRDAYTQGAKSFGPAGTSRLEIVHAAADGDVGYWSGIQHAEVVMKGKKVPIALRITELFRREDGEWKLVHRHADALKAE